MRRHLPLSFLILSAALPLRAAPVTVSTQDGLSLVLDGSTGRIRGLQLDGAEQTDAGRSGGFFVRDMARFAEVPPAAQNLLPNPSLENDLPADGVPDAWTFEDAWFAGATMTYGSDAFQGVKSVTINDRGGGVLWTQDVSVIEGRRYLIQAMTRGDSDLAPYVVWKSDVGDYLIYEGGRARRSTAAWAPAAHLFTAPLGAALADVGFVSVSDGDVTIDQLRMYEAPAWSMSEIAATVSAVPGGATASAALPALGLRFSATLTALPDRIDVEAVLTDTTASDRALEAGFVLPVLARTFWDSAVSSRAITQQTYAETFSYTWWSRIYNDGPWGQDRSIYPFAAVSLGGDQGLALACDLERGPQDLRLFHSTYSGESFTARFRLGLAAEPVRFPREARFRFSLMRVDGRDGFRSALDRYQRAWPRTFARRAAVLGGWSGWFPPLSIPDPQDFGIDVHTWDDDPVGDEAAGILTLGHNDSWDYWLPLGDFSREPTPQEALDRLNFNAAQTADLPLQGEARSVLVSGMHDPAGLPVLEIYQASWMPGSGWGAVCGVDPDPEVTDRSGQGWSSRYQLYRNELDGRFAAAQSRGASLDGAFFDWFRSWHDGAYNHRRTQFETSDVALSYDPANLEPALLEAHSHWDAVRTIADEMRGKGLFTMARDIHFPSFWAAPLIDLFGEEVTWSTTREEPEETLAFYRSVAGKKSYSLMLSGDFAGLDVGHARRRLLLWGLIGVPYWDTSAGRYFWEQPALIDRERSEARRFTALLRLEQQAGWEPLTRARASDPALRLERWGTRSAGLLLWSGWNSGTSPIDARISIDLAALGVAPAEVGRVVDLVEAGVVAATLNGSVLELSDTLGGDAARLYHLHLKGSSTPLVLHAVKRGADVALSWTDAGRPFYERLQGPARDLAGAAVVLETSPAASDPGAVARPGRIYYSVE